MGDAEVSWQQRKLNFYVKNHHFGKPHYKVLCDPKFLELLRENQALTCHISKILGEKKVFCTPRCVLTKEKENATGPSNGNARAKEVVEEVACFHQSWEWKEYNPKHCVYELIKPDNAGRFIWATCDVKRGEAILEEIPSIAVMIGHLDGSVRILEPPASQWKYASEMDEDTVDLIKEERKKWKKRMANNRRRERKDDAKKAKIDDNLRQSRLRKAAADMNKAEKKARLKQRRKSRGRRPGNK